jgi:hypothetical protein
MPMTEAEWLACVGEDTGDMQALLAGKGSDRKLRLFAVACCRRIEHLCSDPRSRLALGFAERDADGEVEASELFDVYQVTGAVCDEILDLPEDQLTDGLYSAALAAHWCAMPFDSNWKAHEVCSHAAFYAQRTADPRTERAFQAKLLCEVLGSAPALQVDPAVLTWNDATVPRIAAGIYAERAFGRMPILHDALLDAGCTDEALLTHCRNPEGHVLGCWALDHILGKE